MQTFNLGCSLFVLRTPCDLEHIARRAGGAQSGHCNQTDAKGVARFNISGMRKLQCKAPLEFCLKPDGCS